VDPQEPAALILAIDCRHDADVHLAAGHEPELIDHPIA
jgi:hypothetical protein